MTNIVDVEGIGEAYVAKFKEIGIHTTEELLEKGASPDGRKHLAEKIGISDKLILRWLNHVDLFRIKGVAGEYSELLEAAGVDTVPELAQRKADHLLAKMTEVNAAKKLVRKLPSESQVKDWVEQAKKLPRVLTY